MCKKSMRLLFFLLALVPYHSTFLAMSKDEAQARWEQILRTYGTNAQELRQLLQAGAAIDTQDQLGITMLIKSVEVRAGTADSMRVLS